MKDLQYEIQFYSPWHCGSGLSAGADVDALVVKDKYGIPFVPGKTIKGLLREAVEAYCDFLKIDKQVEIDTVFGKKGEHDVKGEAQQGIAFFSNANLPQQEADAIKNADAQDYLYIQLSSTAIDDHGVAKKNSLRRMEAVVPCTMEGTIYGVEDDMADIIVKCMGYVKRMGQSRTRGLGRCDFREKKGGKQ